MDERVSLDWNLTRFYKLYEGPSMRALYVAEKVTTQLTRESDIVSGAPTPFILFPFSLANQDLATWRAGILF